MSGVDAFMGEIRPFAFGITPSGWMPCNGALLSIPQFMALFSIVGTRFGGDGMHNFALPDLRGRVPIGIGTGPGLSPRELGQQGGAPAHTLTDAEVPVHGHAFMATETANSTAPGPTALLANTGTAGSAYQPPGTVVAMAPGLLSPSQGGQAHENRQPYLGLNFCICCNGIYPPRAQTGA